LIERGGITFAEGRKISCDGPANTWPKICHKTLQVSRTIMAIVDTPDKNSKCNAEKCWPVAKYLLTLYKIRIYNNYFIYILWYFIQPIKTKINDFSYFDVPNWQLYNIFLDTWNVLTLMYIIIYKYDNK